MASRKINNYIEKAYSGWLEYATFQCSSAKLNGQEGDLLNEALMDILDRKSIEELEDLIDQKKPDNTTGFDAFVLKVIYRNAHLPRSNYQYRYCKQKYDYNADISTFANAHEEEETDPEDSSTNEQPERVYNMMEVEEFVNKSDLSPFAKDVFIWKFVKKNSLKDYKSNKSNKYIHETYQKALEFFMHKQQAPTKQERKTNAMQLILF